MLRGKAIQVFSVPPYPHISHLPPSLPCQPDPGNQLSSSPVSESRSLLLSLTMPKGCAWPCKATGCQSAVGLLFEDRPRLWSNYMGTSHLRSPRPEHTGSQLAPTGCSSKATLFSKLQARKSKHREGLGWRGRPGSQRFITISPFFYLCFLTETKWT